MYEFFETLFGYLVQILQTFFSWLGDLCRGFFDSIKEVLIILLKPILLFFKGLFYLLEKCFDIVVLVVQVIFGIFKVLGSVVLGVFNTFSQLLSYSGSTSHYYMPGAYQQGWDSVTGFLNSTGFSTIAAVMCVFIWLMTAYAVIRIAGGER